MIRACPQSYFSGCKLFLLLVFLLTAFSVFAAEEPIVFPKDHGNHTQQNKDIWTFTGEVETETGDKYAYMYVLKRNQETWRVLVNIVDLATQKEVLSYKDRTQKLVFSSTDELLQWKIGKAFLKYNIISDSWLFGLLDDKNSFNFRLKGVRTYVLNGQNGYLMYEKTHGKEDGRETENFEASYSAQSMNINGHLTVDGKSTFVAGKNSWFEHRWGKILSGHNATKYALVTCRFTDNTGLMLYEWFGPKDLWPARLKTGTYQNSLDKKTLISNFWLTKSTKTNQWFISIPALKINLSGEGDNIPKYDVIKVKKNNKEGFCFISEKGF